MSSLGVKGARGALIGTFGQFIKLGVNIASLVVLARLLSPHDYGLIAMVTAVIGVAEIIRDMGLSSASIQAKHLTSIERSNLWWANTAIGLFCALGTAILAPVLVAFYNEPAVLYITLALSTTFLFNGATTQFRASLVRELRVKPIAYSDISASLIAFFVALYCALTGAGYWALVLQQILGACLSFVFIAFSAGWCPQAYNSSVSIKPYLKYGLPLFGSGVLTYAASNLDVTLIGRFYGTTLLGQYNRAMQLIRMPMNQIRNPLGSMALSTLSKVQDDNQRLVEFAGKAQLIFLYPITLLGMYAAATAAETVPFVLGSRWAEIAPLVAIFAIGDSISNLSSAGGWLYLAKGRSGTLFKYTLLSALVRITLFVFMVPFGFMAIASVYIIAPMILWPISFYICARTTRINTLPLFLTSLRVIILAGFALGASWSAKSFFDFRGSPLLTLTITSLIYIAIPLLLLMVIPRYRKDFMVCLKTLKSILGRSKQ